MMFVGFRCGCFLNNSEMDYVLGHKFNCSYNDFSAKLCSSWLNKLSAVICYFRVDDGSICVDWLYNYWTIIIFIRVLTYVQKTLGKISELCDCLSLFKMYFIMWNLFLSRSECSLCWCPCWPIAKSCMIPFFVNLSGLILVLCLRLDFYPSGLVYWYYVWELLNLAPSVSTIGSV